MPTRRPAPVAALILVLLAAFAAACQRAEQAPPQGQAAVPVTVVTLEPRPVTLTRQLPGRTSPFLVAEVRPQVTGIVEKRLFEEGSLVEAGQPLYQLDDATYQADYDSAQAGLVAARASLDTARVTAERASQLVKSNAVSRQEYDEATAALREAQANVKVAEAAVQSARIQLDYARIESPISGRIGKSTVTRGALVTAAQQDPLATVQQLDPIYVDLTQSASELLELRRALEAGRLVRKGEVQVTLLLDDGSRYAHPGRLTFTDVTVEPTTGSTLLRVQVPNPEHFLLPGMYVRAEVNTGTRPQAILAPQRGITRDPKGNAVALVVGPDDKVQQRQVQVSQTVGDQWLVEDGLAAGDRVIVAGVQKVQPGALVQASEAPAPTQAAEAPAAAAAAARPSAGAGTGGGAATQAGAGADSPSG